MEIVYRTKEGAYPFNRLKQTQNTYVQHIITNSDFPSSQKYRELGRIYKSVTCPYLISLKRVLKNQNEIHFFYQYYPMSIQTYLDKKPHSVLKRLQQEISYALKCLQNSFLKAQLRVQNIAVDHQGSSKMFVTPENLSNGANLNDFYTTQRTRLLMQLEQIWQQNKSEDSVQTKQSKPQNNPGFRISGNELIFTRKQKQNQVNPNFNNQTRLHKQVKQQGHNVHSAQLLLQQIQKHKQKAKVLKYKQNQLKGQTSQQKTHIEQASKHLKALKKNSTSSDSEAMRESHKSQANFMNKKEIEARLINSAAQTSNQKSNNYCKIQDRPTSSLKTEKQGESSHSQLSYQDIRAIAIKHLESEGKQLKEEPKIQVTTEMVSKYKMKIVTCQQIQFQGKEGDDIEKIAQQKLIEYQQQHGLPTISIENAAHHISDETNRNTNSSSQDIPEKKQKSKADCHQSEEIMTKIMKAKEKAEHVLKEYAKAKNK